MLVLALDTATTRITVGLAELVLWPQTWDVRGLAERVAEGVRAHAELLTPAIRDVLAESGHTRTDLDAIVVGRGPGPFTGLRVGLVTAAAMGDALDVPVHGVPTHDAIAAAVPGTVLVVTDARRGEVYWSRYVDEVRTHGPEVAAPADLVARLRPGGDLGPADEVRGDAVASIGAEHSTLPGPAPAGLVARAAPALRAGIVPGPLVPLYLRRPDAVPPGAPKAVTRPDAQRSGAGPSTPDAQRSGAGASTPDAQRSGAGPWSP